MDQSFTGRHSTAPTLSGAYKRVSASNDNAPSELLTGVNCFAEGTRIATQWGYLPVQRLRIGDLVKSMFSAFSLVKWVGMRSYEGRFIAGNRQALPIRIRQHAIARNVPSRDLYVSPDHAICVGGVLLPAWRLINGISIKQMENVEDISYFHVELYEHNVIFAENCPAESFRDTDNRLRFQNAAEFQALYPEAATEAPLPPCLPVLEEGFYLDHIRRRLASRAGYRPAAIVPGPMRGAVDEAGPGLVRGWAQDIAAPEEPVTLEILAGGQPVAQCLANAYRPDLRKAGRGSGCHGFSLSLPGHEAPFTVRRASDGAPLLLGAAAATA